MKYFFNKIRIYLVLRPNLLWSLVSFCILFAMLFIVNWSDSAVPSDFKADETFEMVELRLAGPMARPEIKESSNWADAAKKEIIEEKPLQFGTDSEEFLGLENAGKPPRPLFSRPPKYPDSMRKAGIEGRVVIELGINESGDVVYGKIVESLGADFDKAVIEWAKKIKFYPARTKDKEPMKCRIKLPVRFKLEG